MLSRTYFVISQSMKTIQMVDLKGQYEAIKESVNSSVLDVIESTAFINGLKYMSFKKV